MKLKQGRDGRTLLVNNGDGEKLIGIVDTPELARRIVGAESDKERLRKDLDDYIQSSLEKDERIESLQDQIDMLRELLGKIDDDLWAVRDKMNIGPHKDILAPHRLQLEKLSEGWASEALGVR